MVPLDEFIAGLRRRAESRVRHGRRLDRSISAGRAGRCATSSTAASTRSAACASRSPPTTARASCSTSACRSSRRTAATSPAARRSGRPQELIAEGVLVDVPGVFPHDPTAPDVAAIVLTHSHLDHYGLAHHAHPAIPVYGSEGTLAILEVGRVFFPDARAARATCACCPTDEPLRFGGLSRDRDPRRPRGARLARAARRGRRPAPALHRRPARPRAHRLPLREPARRRAPARRRLAALRGHDAGLVGRLARPAQRGRRRGASSSSWRASEPGQARRRRRLGPEPRPPRLLLPGRAAQPAASSSSTPTRPTCCMQLAPLSPNIPQFTWDGRARELRAPPGRAPQGGRPHGPRPRDERAGPRRRATSSPRSPGASSCARAAAAA